MDTDNLYSSSNSASMNTMYSTTFGTGNFMIRPPKLGNVEDGFPTIPYVSLEAIFYEQQASNPMSAPYTVMAGGSAGQQVISSVQTANDSSTTPRYLIGTQTKG
jgi:hypothetical protein